MTCKQVDVKCIQTRMSEDRLSFPESRAIFFITLLLALAPAANAQENAAPKTPAAHAGLQVYTQKCFQCHSVLPDQVRFGPSLYGELNKPHPKKTDAQVRAILQNGKGKMPPFKGVLTQQDTNDLLAYLHSL